MLSKLYNSKWFPRFFYTKPDGGEKSGVTAFFLLEWKPVCSIGLLRFSQGSREAYHNHAFHAVTFWLKGRVTEELKDGTLRDFEGPRLTPKLTLRSCYHKIIGHTQAWAFTIRGPWEDTWKELRPDGEVVLTHGRREVNPDGVWDRR